MSFPGPLRSEIPFAWLLLPVCFTSCPFTHKEDHPIDTHDHYDVDELADMLRRLRSTDKKFRVFGSDAHRYQMESTLSERKIAEFEFSHGIRLPEDYRRFLAVVGNGGAGPYYGMAKLGDFGRLLREPFRFEVPELPLEEGKSFVSDDEVDISGVLEFCHHGCAAYSYLVVTGVSRGTIWSGSGEEFIPESASFHAWYRHWLERALRYLDHDHLVPLFRVGMTRTEVFSRFGENWDLVERRAERMRMFHGRDFAVSLAFEENDVVVRVRLWSSL